MYIYSIFTHSKNKLTQHQIVSTQVDTILRSLSTALENVDVKGMAEVFRFVSFGSHESFGPHLHRRIEINYLKRGRCTMVINSQNVSFNEGDVMVLLPEVSHSFESGPTGCTLMQLEFLPDIFDRFSHLLGDYHDVESIYDPKRPRYLKLINNTEFTASVQAILSELGTNRPSRVLMVTMHYGILLVHLYRRLNELFISGSSNPILCNIVAYVRENFAGRITVNEVAAHFNITERYMRRLFVKHLDCAPSEYINRLRIEKATELLSDCNERLSIKEICYRCGFSSPQYFSRVYKQATGMRPRAAAKLSV